jgi:hypothetical protein
MFSAPTGPLLAGVQATLVAATFLFLGYLVVDCFLGRRIDRVTAWGLALPGLFLFSLPLMLVHIASGGRVFSSPVATWVFALLLAIGLVLAKILRRRRSPAEHRGPRVDLWIVVGLLALGLLVWGSPVFRLLPLHYGPDIRLHLGWGAQLMNGHSTPTSGMTGEIPNYYPWMFHALMALVTHFTPGGRTFHSLSVFQVLQFSGAILALFALGRNLTGSRYGGIGAAVFGGLTGGFGFLISRGPDLVLSSRADTLQFLGDLLPRRSYNLAFHNLAPVYPREMCFALLIAFLLLLVVGLRDRSVVLLTAAGVTLGIIGLTGGEAFILGLGVAVLTVVFPSEVGRRHKLMALLIPAVGLALLWYGPLVVNYVRLGGFRNTASSPVVYTPIAFLVAYGITAPFALYGILRWRPRGWSEPQKMVPMALLVVTVGLLALAGMISILLGEGFVTLGRQHRYWPFFYLAAAVYATLGFDAFARRLAATRTYLAPVAAGVVMALALPSPVLASLAIPEKLPPEDMFQDAVRGDESAFLTALAPSPGMPCVAAVPPQVAPQVFAYTGYRLVSHSLSPRNPGRIRWRDIRERIGKAGRRIADNLLLTEAQTSPEKWEELADSYEIDVLVIRGNIAEGKPFREYEKTQVRGPRNEVTVVWLSDCEVETLAGGVPPGLRSR